MNPDWITAFEALKSVYIDGAYSNIAINEAISHHKGCRDSFVRSLAKGTLRYTVTLDAIIGRLAKGGIRKVRKRTLIILRMGLFAIRSMDSVPDHAAVSEAVTLTRRTAKGTDGFVNAVLRSYLRQREDIEADCDSSLSLKYSFPESLISLLSEQYGEETENILSGLNSHPQVILRVNTLRTDREELAGILAGEGVITENVPETERALAVVSGRVIDTEAFRKGLFTVQSLSSILAIEALAPSPGSRVLDMCAAPGGKTAMMAEMMGNEGEITACDIHAHRAELIDATAGRLGTDIISSAVMDGTVHDGSLDDSFDYVLADVPCSGLGVIGSKPEIGFRTDTESLDGLYEIQSEILRNAVRYAKPGGRIEYSTCTLNRNENEIIVRKVAEDESLVRIVENCTVLPYNNLVGFYYCILEKTVKHT